MSFLLELLHAKIYPPADPTTSLAHRTVLITGANCGLGFEAALKITSLGASTVILACRTKSKGETAAAEIKRLSKRPDADLRVWDVDMCDQFSVARLAARCETDLPGGLDIALLNAGVVQSKQSLSAEGWEQDIQVNVVSTMLLGIALLPTLRKSNATAAPASGEKVETDGSNGSIMDTAAHLVFVSSGQYSMAPVSPELFSSTSPLRDCSRPNRWAGTEPQYNLSKLFLTYAVNELAARYPLDTNKTGGDREVIITQTNPGATQSNLTRNIDSVVLRVVAFVTMKLLARTTEQGSRTLVSGCTVGREGHGGFWAHDQFESLAEIITSSNGQKLQKSVWAEIQGAMKRHAAKAGL